MCGRYILLAKAKHLAAYFKIDLDTAIDIAMVKPRFNVAPTQTMPLFRLNDESGRPELSMLKWGLVPSWSKTSKSAYSTINAVGETIDAKPTYRAAFKKRRCLVPMSGFYEWLKLEDGTKQPYLIKRKDEELLAVAGVWEHWEKDGEVIESYSLITTEANETMKPLHHRMPVILAPEDFAAWVGPGEPEEKKAMLKPCPNDWLMTFPVSKVVNNPRNDKPECIEPFATV